jgi:hypothetical protein
LTRAAGRLLQARECLSAWIASSGGAEGCVHAAGQQKAGGREWGINRGLSGVISSRLDDLPRLSQGSLLWFFTKECRIERHQPSGEGGRSGSLDEMFLCKTCPHRMQQRWRGHERGWRSGSVALQDLTPMSGDHVWRPCLTTMVDKGRGQVASGPRMPQRLDRQQRRR